MTDKNDTVLDPDELYSLTVTIDDVVHKLEDVAVESMREARERSRQLRENAPDREYLTESRTYDVDEVIEALEAAKERGVETVQVNDDRVSMARRLIVTNNYLERSPIAPEPKELFEWMEL